MLTLLLMKLESIEHARFRAISQIVIDKEKGISAFEEYMKLAFPYLEATKRRERQGHVEHLKSWVGRGPMAIRALPQANLKSRVAAARARVKPQSQQEEQQLYKKIGRSI